MHPALLRRRRGGSAVARFAANGSLPKLVVAPTDGLYAANGVPTTQGALLTHTRASTATYVDSTGTLQTAASGVLRDAHHVYEGGQWVNKGIFLESESRTNLVTYSEDFTNVYWSGTNVGTLAIDAIGPDGNTSAVTLRDDEATGQASVFVRANITTTISTEYTVSTFLKADGLSWGLLFITGIGPSGNGGVYFDLSSGLVGTQDSGFIGRIEDVGGGWFRCSMSFTSHASTTAGQFRIYVADADNDVLVDLDGTSSILIYGAQFEAGRIPSSYTPTTGSAGDRALETLTTDDATSDTSAMWGALKGAETFADEGTAGQVELLDWRVDANNRITITIDTDGAETGEITLTMVNGGSSASVAVDHLSPGINQAFSIGWRVTGSEIGVSVDGGAEVTTATAIGVPDLSSADIAFEGMGTRSLITQGVGDIGTAGTQEASA